MLYELRDIIQQTLKNQTLGLKSVLATVVDLDGSSYRRPGVRMLLSSDGKMVGAVSGGCVEKEVQRSAKFVFETGVSKMMTYDGRYRLGCEGVLYVLLEPFEIAEELMTLFFDKIEERIPVFIKSYYQKEGGVAGSFYSTISFGTHLNFRFSIDREKEFNVDPKLKIFKQTLDPCFKLYIVGGEHDAMKLCYAASLLGWEVDVITSVKDPKVFSDFKGAKTVLATTPENFDFRIIDAQCAVVLMTHNYAQDLSYLLKIKDCNLPYIGILGSAKRRDVLKNDLLDYTTEISIPFLDSIHSPAGLNIGAITPAEIALSILSEILTIVRNKKAVHLKSISKITHPKV